ncbi:hypothetical protein D7Z94_14730 [Ulvibacterium marinum]|uniref:Uncharacterized protein n=1 Tax=Ulvibacterium marinum TaxID=2419782 RepID=A0A3B0C7S5_9FLAO|nr:hypothetical protein D7Z94_14730 [Ulvibacterium marinum]
MTKLEVATFGKEDMLRKKESNTPTLTSGYILIGLSYFSIPKFPSIPYLYLPFPLTQDEKKIP